MCRRCAVDKLIQQWEYRCRISRAEHRVDTEEDERALTPEEVAEENERAEREEQEEQENEWVVWLSVDERRQAEAMGYIVHKLGKTKRVRLKREFRPTTRREFKCSFCWRDFVAKPGSERRCYHCGRVGGW